MRCELMQMERMAIDERFGSDAGDTTRRINDMRRRMRLEREAREEQGSETLGDLFGDFSA